MKPITFNDYKNKYEWLSLDRQDGILTLSIHNKNKKDEPVVWGIEPHDELSHVFNDIARDYENQCVIITGTADEFIGSETSLGAALSPIIWDPVYQHAKYLLTNLLSIEVPVIGAVSGAAHVHAELAVLSDIVICSDTAEFQDAPHFPDGVVPGDGVQVVWPLVLGPNRGRYFLLTGQKIKAKEALELGIVSEVLPKAKLMPRAMELAREICKRPILVRRYARVAMTQALKQAILDNVGYGLAMEGLSAAVSWGMPKK